MGLILKFGLILIGLSLTEAAPAQTSNKTSNKPLVIGHRGASGYKPEHTLVAYQLAIEQGADYIEPDLVSTKDGVLVARHENEISGTTDVATKFPDRKVTKVIDGQSVSGWFTEDFTLAELKTLRAKERLEFRNRSDDFKHPIPTFEEVVALAKKKSVELKREIGIIPELKHPTYFKAAGLDLVPLLAKELKRLGLDSPQREIIVQSFELNALTELKALSRVRLLYLIGDLASRPADFVARNDARTYADMLSAQNLSSTAKIAWGLGPAKDHLINEKGQSTGALERARAAGLKVIPYTFRNEAQYISKAAAGNATSEYKLFYKLGVDGLFTDFPDTAVKAR